MSSKKKQKKSQALVRELNQKARESGLTSGNNYGAADTAESGSTMEPVVPPEPETQPAPVPVVLPPTLAAKLEMLPPEALATSDRFPNRLRKSEMSLPTKSVWAIADAMMAADPTTRRKDVIAACVAAKIAFYTARTQYQQWYAAQKRSREQAATAASPMVKAS